MAKQLNINLGFTVDVSQAQANIQALQQSLNQISSIKPIGGGALTKEMQIAVNSAKSLEQHLTNAFNVKTGNFDLNKLSLSLRQSGESLNGLSAGLLRAGENGERAFMNVQRALTTANVQINKSNGMLAQFASTLKNTARWQLSSSLLHGFVSGLNQAISYSKDLDKSLNNIRIVTGYSAEDMQDFARSANEAAKALSSTTNEYAKASLIYFQQGLGAEEVKERTDATIKMANVSGQSAETVSDQMTAVWNNFDDGSKSLEYYADVMVKLGAETASSSDEIAGGLEKFAAVGKTIGLSYEYAAAALATITARTRQSEDVVGTALKTIFARIQGLKLGETLEDGVELNKYSEALQSVGISIFEQNGELKKMDNILNEMGTKWGTLSKAQQVALAQTVAGVRQYTQLISLMDSWNDGQGSFQENLELAKNSTGSLDKQQRTYEESWQAASKRIRASLEGIWEDLIPSDSIIGITDMLAGLLNIIDRLIEGFGGLEGIILLVATIAINKMGPSIANGIDLAITRVQEFKQHLADQNMLSIGGIAQTIKSNFMNMFTPAATSAAQLRENVQAIKYETDSLEKGMAFYNEHLKSGASATTQMLQNMNAEAATQDTLSSSFKQYLADTTQINNLQAMIEANKRKMTQADLDSLSALQSAATAAAERKAIEQETLELIQLQIDHQRMQVDNNLYDSANYMEDDTSSMMLMDKPNSALTQTQSYTDGLNGVEFWTKQIEQVTALKLEINQLPEGILLVGESANAIGEASVTAREMFADMHSLNLQLNKVLKDGNVPIEKRKENMQKIITDALRDEKITAKVAEQYKNVVNKLQDGNKSIKTFSSFTSRITNGIRNMAKGLGNTEKSLNKAAQLREDEFDAQQNLNQATSQHKNLIDQVVNGLNKGLSGLSTWGGQISKTISGFSRLAMAANTVKNAIETLNDPDADFTSKLVSSTMALSMGFSALIPVIQGITNGISAYNAVQGSLIATTTTYTAVNKLLADSKTRATLATALGTAATNLGEKATKENMAAELQSIIVDKLKVSSEEAETIAKQLAVAWSHKAKEATDAETVANYANATSQMAKHWILLLVVAALALVAAATWWVVAAVKADNEEAKKNAKAMSELNEKTKELADSTESLEGEIKSLTKTFSEQKAAGEDVSETYNELVEKLNEVKSNYKKLNVSSSTLDLLEQAEALGLATGNWEAYNKAQAEAQAQVENETGRQAEATTRANLKGAAAVFTDGHGSYEQDDKGKYVKRHVGNFGITDKEISNILEKYDEIFKDVSGDDATLRIDYDNENEFMKDYQMLADALRDMEMAGKASHDTYKELNKEFELMAEYAGEIEENLNEATKHKMKNKLKELGINPESIDTLEEYTAVVEKMTTKMTSFFTSSEEARKQVKSFLGTFSNTAEAGAAYSFLEKFNNKLSTAINYKKTEDKMTINQDGIPVSPTKTSFIEVEAKYDEKQVEQEVKAMYDYIEGLPEKMRKIAIGIDLEYIDSLAEFKQVFEKTRQFETKVKIKANPESIIESAKKIRDDLSDAMEDFSKQGYLTTTQTIEFLDEFPEYSKYLIETSQGYAFTEEAIEEFNDALQDEKEALSELLNPTNVGAKALYDFGKELIALEAAVEGEGLKKFITDMQELTTQFIEGKIKADEYFVSLNENINSLAFDENTSINDIMAFGKDVVPSMVNGIDSYLGAIDEAFEKGSIGAIEFRKALTDSANAVLKLEAKTREAIKTTGKLSGIKLNEQTGYYEKSVKWMGELDQKTQDVVDSLNESIKRSKELADSLQDMTDFEGINVAATEDYDDLQAIFDEDFSIEIDSSQLDAAIAKTKDYRDSLAEAFNALDTNAQANVINKILEIGSAMGDVGNQGYEMQTDLATAFAGTELSATTTQNNVQAAAIDMLNGTYVATSENTELTAAAMGLILESGANTSQLVAQMTSRVIENIGELISNFDATIQVRGTGFQLGIKKYKMNIFGKEFELSLPVPTFDIGFKGALGEKSQSTLKNIVGDLQGISMLTSGDSGGGMSSFAPKKVEGNPKDVQLDEEPDTKEKVKQQPKVEKPEYRDDSDKTKFEDEEERYYHITNRIEDLNRELDSLSKAKDDAFGANRIAAMNAEIAKLKQVRTATKQYRDEIATRLGADKAKAESFGAVIGEDGIISNRNEMMNSWVEELNSIKVDTYNSYEDKIVALKNQSNAIDSEEDKDGSKKNALDSQIKELETQRNNEIKNAEATFEARKKAFVQYEETRDLLAETNAELEEQLRKIQQLNYDKIMYTVEYKIEINDRALKLLDKKTEAIEKRIFHDIEAFAVISDNAEKQLDLLLGTNGEENPYDWYKKQFDDLQLGYQLGLEGSEEGISETMFQEGLEKTQDQLEEQYDTIVKIDEKMQEYYENAINDGLDLIHTYEEGFDGFLDTLEHYSNVMTLIGQEKNYEGMNAILEGRITVLEGYISSSQQTVEDLETQIGFFEGLLQDPNLHPDTKRYYEQQLITLNQALREESAALNGYFEQMGETANQVLKNNIDSAMKEMRDQITGGIDLDYLMKDMERLNTYQEDYLTNTNKMYETNKLISKAQTSIDKTQNIQAKQKYQQYIKYIESLQISGELSKQELKMAQAKYDILEAEMALEEAKNAKSQVRLTRDSEGNFGYVYTANKDDTAAATQNYLDKQNELYNISLEGSKEYREKYLQNIQSMLDEVEALEYAFRIDHTIDQEEYEKQKLIIQEYYGEQAKSYADLFNHAQWELSANSYSTLMEQNDTFNSTQLSKNKNHYSLLEASDAQYIGGLDTGMSVLHQTLEKDLEQFNINSYKEVDDNYIALQIRDGQYYTSLQTKAFQTQAYIRNQMSNPTTNSAAHHMNKFSKTTDTAFHNCELAGNRWEKTIIPLNERVGKSFAGDDDNSGLKGKIDKVTGASNELKDKLRNDVHPAVSDTWTKVGNLTKQWETHRSEIDNAKRSYMNLATEIQNTLDKMKHFDQKSAAPAPVSSSSVDSKYTTPPSTSSSSSVSNSSSSKSGGGNGTPEVGDLVTYLGGEYYNSSDGKNPHGTRGPGRTVEITKIQPGALYPIHVKSNDSAFGWLKQSQISGYDTGGYTGDWGPEGKLAILHEKELVLNEQDTQNFLTATNILREVSQMLDNNALLASLGMINLSAITIGTPADQVLQQEVTIHADFPNVSDHTEIEMAIDNLINAASQYANRK